MSEIVVTRSDQGKTVDAHPGDAIVIRIEENLTTGYSWEVESGKGSVMDLESSTYAEAAGAGLGRSGTRVLRFVALGQGQQEVILQLRRPWDPAGKAIERFSITIRIR